MFLFYIPQSLPELSVCLLLSFFGFLSKSVFSSSKCTSRFTINLSKTGSCRSICAHRSRCRPWRAARLSSSAMGVSCESFAHYAPANWRGGGYVTACLAAVFSTMESLIDFLDALELGPHVNLGRAFPSQFTSAVTPNRRYGTG